MIVPSDDREAHEGIGHAPYVRTSQFANSLFTVVVLAAVSGLAAAAESPSCHVLAAGSLRASMEAVAADFERAQGGRVSLAFGPSGLLRERIEHGEPADVFASANMEHPQSLVRSGKATSAQSFASNRMCVLGEVDRSITT
ncbi:MAG TPA: substrate-binding domain-containing protein [Usitatibacter sp.]|nr:substrate-binding domain-containing protein [Usitatibacter sp.]